MRSLTVILVLASLCIQCFVQLGIVGWYQAHVREITEKYCVNKSKPELRCQGKCHLKKQLNKAKEKESKGQNPSGETEWTVFILPVPSQTSLTAALAEVRDYMLLAQRYSFRFPHSVFRPPRPSC